MERTVQGERGARTEKIKAFHNVLKKKEKIVV